MRDEHKITSKSDNRPDWQAKYHSVSTFERIKRCYCSFERDCASLLCGNNSSRIHWPRDVRHLYVQGFVIIHYQRINTIISHIAGIGRDTHSTVERSVALLLNATKTFALVLHHNLFIHTCFCIIDIGRAATETGSVVQSLRSIFLLPVLVYAEGRIFRHRQ